MQKIITLLHPRIFIMCAMLLLHVTLSAQQINVSGKITDGKQDLIGATVMVVGTNKAVVTNNLGDFTLNGVAPNGVLHISYIGYKSKKVPINGRILVNVALEEDTQLMDDVVVVGYGTQKKQTLTGAISTLGGDDVITTKSSSIAQSLQGKIAGVQIRQQDGQPGSFSSMIQIRGLGSPLYVIDGVLRDSGDGAGEFQRLTPEDIESISVLKDGTAAIYGMNAASGVIIVTTKKGSKGRAKFSYNGSMSIVKPTSILKTLNAAQYMEVMNEYSVNNGTGPITTPEELAKWREGGPGYTGTDWLGETFKKFAVSTQHTLSVEGGNDKVTYYSSLGYVKDGDLTRGDDFNYNRYNFRSNVSAKLSKYLTADINISGRYDNTTSPIDGVFNLMFQSTITRPTESVYANGNKEYYNYTYPLKTNPVALMDGDLTGLMNKRNRSFMSTASLRFDVPWVKGLFLKGMASYDASDSRETHERKAYRLYSYESKEDKYNPFKMRDLSTLYLSMYNGNRLNIQAQIGYSNTFNKVHNVSAMALYEMTENWNDWGNAARQYDIYAKPIIDQGSATSGLTNGGSYDKSANISYLGRLNYDYKGKYLVELAFRYSGSYRYAPEHRWGFFPVASVGWRVSEEAFIKKNIPFLNNLKVRASYGITGVDAGDLFQYVEGFITGANVGYEFEDGTLTSGVGMPTLVNRDLTWQESKTLDLGFDATLWDGMLDITFDLYQRDMTKVPTNPISQVTNTFGATLPQINYNEYRTQGIEFTIGHRNRINEVTYEIAGNMNFARTQNTRVLRGDYGSSWDYWHDGGATGRWLGVGWGYKTLGQFQSMDQIYNHQVVEANDKGNTLVYPGDYYLKDVNGDGYIDGNDALPMYYSVGMPALNFGINIGVQWKNFDLYALFQGSACYTIRIPDNLRNYAPWDGNSSGFLYDRWHREDPFDPNSQWIPGKMPSARHMNNAPYGNNAIETDRNTVKGDYLRLKSVELGYTLPHKVSKYIGLEKVRVYVNAYNVWTLYNSFLKNELKVDPEKTAGQDDRMLNYPLASTITFGVNVNF